MKGYFLMVLAICLTVGSLYLRWSFDSYEDCIKEGYVAWECKLFGLDKNPATSEPLSNGHRGSP